ncbi:uncharacterized protein [Leptinotarsa decemlineata]|uniref:uncharacterized protein n=1 Tax=Leptinotarsa decemlineata TaxID=7539 RepID=UPI003D30BA62
MMAVGRVLLLVAVLGYVGITLARGECLRCKRDTIQDPGLTAEGNGSARIGAGVSGDADGNGGVSDEDNGAGGGSFEGSGSVSVGDEGHDSGSGNSGSKPSGVGDIISSVEGLLGGLFGSGFGKSGSEDSKAGSDQGDVGLGGSVPEGSGPGSGNVGASDGDNGAGGGSFEGSGSVSVGADGHDSDSGNSGSKHSGVGDIVSSLGGLFGGLFGSGKSGSEDSGPESSGDGSIIGGLIGSLNGSGSGSGPNSGSVTSGSSGSEGPVTFPDPNTNGLPSGTNDNSQDNDGDGSSDSAGSPSNGSNGEYKKSIIVGLDGDQSANQEETDGIGQGGSQAGAHTGGQGGDNGGGKSGVHGGTHLIGSIEFGSPDNDADTGNSSIKEQIHLDPTISNLANAFKSYSWSDFMKWIENYLESFKGDIDETMKKLLLYVTKSQKTGISMIQSGFKEILKGTGLIIRNVFYRDGLMISILDANNKTLNCLIDSSQDLPDKVDKTLVNCPAETANKVIDILKAIVESFRLLVSGFGNVSNKVFYDCVNMSCRVDAVSHFGVNVGDVIPHLATTLLKVVQLLATPAALSVCLAGGTITGVASELYTFGKTSLECFQKEHVF